MHVCVGWWILCSSRCSLFYIFLGVKISVFFFFYDYLRWPFNLLFCFYLRNQVVEMFNIREELKRSPSQEGWTGSWEKIWRRTCWWNSCGSLEWVGWKQRQWPSGTRSARSSSAGKWRGRNREWSFSAAHRTSPARSCFASRKTGPADGELKFDKLSGGIWKRIGLISLICRVFCEKYKFLYPYWKYIEIIN